MSRTHKAAPTKQHGSEDPNLMVHGLWLHVVSEVAVGMHTLWCTP